MTSVLERLSSIIGDAFDDAGLPRELGQVNVSDRPDLAQFQCNGAMAAAKIAKKNPRQIAEGIVETLQGNAIFSEISIAGPGFINLILSDGFLSAEANAILTDDRSGAGRLAGGTVVLDFGGPNVAKPMHVGHLRSTIIGDALQRLSRFTGHKTISDVHMGDWGKPIGMLITELKRARPDLPYFDETIKDGFPNESPVTMDDLERMYPKAAAECKADAQRDEEARLATAELQSGRPGYRALWRHFINVSQKGMEREFGALGVHFDLWKGEADADPLIAEMVADLKRQSLVEQDQGAGIIRVAQDDDKTDMPPLILVKSDGAATYATTDLATIHERVRDHNPDVILYVVDQRQHTHFEQVFRAARKGGLNGHAKLEHIGFGTMNGPDGKPFKTRAGGVMKLHDLITMMRDKAAERLREAGLAESYGEEERDSIADMVGIAALKFADLSNHRLSDYIFDLDRFMRFEGKTGPYLQYAAVRIQSILRKAEDEGVLEENPVITIGNDTERGLVLNLLQFPEAVTGAFDKRAPNILCEHVYSLAQGFSRFYSEHHILSESDENVRASRLGLCQVTLRQVSLSLNLLGIQVPTRM